MFEKLIEWRIHQVNPHNKFPYEAWTCIKQKIDHLRLFGCLAHVKTLSGNLKKLEDKSRSWCLLVMKKVAMDIGYMIHIQGAYIS